MSAPAAADLRSASVALIGAGNMGIALLEGWAAHGLVGEAVVVVEPTPSPRLLELCQRRGFRLAAQSAESAPRDALVLAVKPQMLAVVAPTLSAFIGADTLALSILAGKRISDLRAQLPGARAIVRAMPNTPAAIGRGVTGAVASDETSARQRALAQALLSAVGGVEWVEDEGLIDAVTAVSGSGPAYVFHLVECLAEAGGAAGLPADLSMRLARATVEGAGELLARRTDATASTLRENVTSPGGTTAAALDVLMASDGLAALMTRAVAAAKRRAGELSG